MGQQLEPQEKAGSRREPRHGGQPAGEVGPGVMLAHAPPCLSPAGPDGIDRRTAIWRECRDAEATCQQERYRSGTPWCARDTSIGMGTASPPIRPTFELG